MNNSIINSIKIKNDIKNLLVVIINNLLKY